VKFVTGADIGRTHELSQLQSENDVVLLATGAT
jgi:NADPH-dependent glutamate synthase beta subunit-like oxidoreductase